MKQAFKKKNFQPRTLAVIAMADDIIQEYQAQGFSLTLRQLYYQFVARDILPNTERSYKSLGKIISNARLAGHLDWDAIEDRTRSLEKNLHLDNPRRALELLRDHWYGINMWKNQPERVEVWIEKEALVGVIDGVCTELDVPYFACRGFVSQSEQWRAGRRFREYHHIDNQRTVVLHLGDHDPSGIDMTRDNDERLLMFAHFDPSVVVLNRIALNMDQIDEYSPPPNPAKQKDARFQAYQRLHGDVSWELDALEPQVLVDLIREKVDEIRDPGLWEEREAQLEEDMGTLTKFIEELEE